MTEDSIPSDPIEVDPEVLKALDELLTAVAEGTVGGRGRRSIFDQPPSVDRRERLLAELTAATQMLRQKNTRAAARRRQASKRRGLNPPK